MKYTWKKVLMLLLVVGVAGVTFISTRRFQESFGWFAWNSLHSESLATTLNKTDPTLFFDIGNYYFGEGAYDLKKAETFFRKSLALDPELQGSHYQLARIYFILSDFYTAEIEINAELELHPEFGRSHYVRGLIYGYSGRLKEAEAEFIEFLKWKPDSWAGNNDLAWIYFQEGKYAAARDIARAGLEIAPNNPWLLNSLGVALLNTDDKAGAKEAFTKALALLNSMTEANWGAAYPGNNPGVYGEGLSQMRKSIQKNLTLLDGVDSTKPGPLW